MPDQPPDYTTDDPIVTISPDGFPQVVTISDQPLYTGSDIVKSDTAPFYLAFGYTTVYQKDHGLRGSGVAAAKFTKPAAFWRVHSGQCIKTVTWVAMAAEQVPVAPHTDTGNPNEVLLHETIGLIGPCNAPDGQRAIGIYGIYVYLLQQFPAPTDPLFMGDSPFDVDPSQVITPDQFSKYIIGPAPAPAAFMGGTIGY
jgi:hypothetical protein